MGPVEGEPDPSVGPLKNRSQFEWNFENCVTQEPSPLRVLSKGFFEGTRQEVRVEIPPLTLGLPLLRGPSNLESDHPSVCTLVALGHTSRDTFSPKISTVPTPTPSWFVPPGNWDFHSLNHGRSCVPVYMGSSPRSTYQIPKSPNPTDSYPPVPTFVPYRPRLQSLCVGRNFRSNS